MVKDIRWIQRFSNYNNALTQLEDAVKLSAQRELTSLEKQGLIQAFEFTHELAWKTLKDFLEHRGVTEQLFGSKDTTRQAFSKNLLNDGDIWMNMIKSRNLTSHTYDEKTVETIINNILSDYAPQFKLLRDKLNEIRSQTENH